jgi:hypothetical protein
VALDDTDKQPADVGVWERTGAAQDLSAATRSVQCGEAVVSEIKLEPSQPMASIELREIAIDGADVNHPFLQRMRRENAARAAAAFAPRVALAPPQPPDMDELLLQQRLANRAEIVARDRLTAAEAEEEIAKSDLEVARSRLAELAEADRAGFEELAQERKVRLARAAEALRRWLLGGRVGERPEVPPSPAPSLERSELDQARIEVEVCESVLNDASAAVGQARQDVHQAIVVANCAARRAIAGALDEISVRYEAGIEGAIAEWDLGQVANMAQFPLEPGGVLRPLAEEVKEVSPRFRAMVSGPPRHTIEFGTEIGGLNSGRGAAYAEYLRRRFRELREMLPEEEPEAAA